MCRSCCLCWTSSAFLSLLSDHIQTSFSSPPAMVVYLLGHFFPCFESISSTILFFFPSAGWETGHSCRGTASLSRVALSLPSPKHTDTSNPGNCLSLKKKNPTVVRRKWQLSFSSRHSPVFTLRMVTLTFNFSPPGLIHDLSSICGSKFIFDF